MTRRWYKFSSTLITCSHVDQYTIHLVSVEQKGVEPLYPILKNTSELQPFMLRWASATSIMPLSATPYTLILNIS